METGQMYLDLFLAGEHSPFLADWTVMCMQSQLNANTSNSSDLFLWFQITADDTCDAAYSYASCENSGYNTVLIQLPSRNSITKPEILISWAFKSLLENPPSVWYFFDDGLKKKRVWVGVMKYLHAKEEKCEFWVFRIKHSASSFIIWLILLMQYLSAPIFNEMPISLLQSFVWMVFC